MAVRFLTLILIVYNASCLGSWPWVKQTEESEDSYIASIGM